MLATDPFRVRAEKRILIDKSQVFHRQNYRAELRKKSLDVNSQAFPQIFARDRSGSDAHRRLPRRRSSAAAIIANAVFLLVAVVGMAWTELVLDIAVIMRTLIGVFDQQADRRAGRFAFEDAGKYSHPVCFIALCSMARPARSAPLEVLLYVRLCQFESRRTAVDNATHSRAVAFPKGGHRKKPPESVT
jgi:hypothetical protein